MAVPVLKNSLQNFERTFDENPAISFGDFWKFALLY